MTEPRLQARSLRLLRWRARAPRLVVLGCLSLLALAGLRAAVAPAGSSSHPVSPVRTGIDPTVGSFAEAFARVYLAWDPAAPERREQLLARFLSRDLDPDGGLTPARARRQRVEWSSV